MYEFLAPLAWQFGLPGLGAFVGTVAAQYLNCPNRGCCQMTKIKEVIERGR